MRILLLTHAFNSLTQRLFIELRQRKFDISVEFDINDEVTQQAVDLFNPDLIIAPFLKRKIPDNIWEKKTCLIVHPGIIGDRGPSSLDWAILNKEKIWGVTVLQANEEMDAGDIYASCEFNMRLATKSSLYRNEITDSALTAVLEAINNYQSKSFKAQKLDYKNTNVKGRLRPLVQQKDRKISWQRDDSETILRKIYSADGMPGVLDNLFGRELFLYDAQKELTLKGKPGDVIARNHTAICIATIDAAVWIGHLRDKNIEHNFKLPATYLLTEEIKNLPYIDNGYRDIYYEEESGVGYLHFSFYNGAMDTDKCKRLQQHLIKAKQQKSTKVIVLMGGKEYWSNGMNLNIIEAAKSPADESWDNINAMDDLVLEIINTNSHLIVSTLMGNTGAGGVFLARAADEVWAKSSIVLNPHYKDMGNLYGSEYWSYLLPKHTSDKDVKQIMGSRLPVGIKKALSIGLVDESIDGDNISFIKTVKRKAEKISNSSSYDTQLKQKNEQREKDENNKPLQQYRNEELSHMKRNFYGFDTSYHIARYNFVFKVKKSRTPVTIARHRKQS